MSRVLLPPMLNTKKPFTSSTEPNISRNDENDVNSEVFIALYQCRKLDSDVGCFSQNSFNRFFEIMCIVIAQSSDVLCLCQQIYTKWKEISSFFHFPHFFASNVSVYELSARLLGTHTCLALLGTARKHGNYSVLRCSAAI